MAEHDDIRGVRMGAGERSYLVRDRRIDVLRNVHGGVQARPPCSPARAGGLAALAGRLSRGTCVGATPAYPSSFHAVHSHLAGCGDAEWVVNLKALSGVGVRARAADAAVDQPDADARRRVHAAEADAGAARAAHEHAEPGRRALAVQRGH